MTKLESAKEIVKQRGGCIDIQCSDCCLSPGNCGGSVNCLHLAKEYLEKHRAKNKMTKLESAKIIVKQHGACIGIRCSKCCLNDDCGENKKYRLTAAKEYIEEHEAKNMVLISNDNVHWKERELVMIYDNHYLCKTKDDGYKIWKHKKELPITETRYQYLYKSPNGVYLTTPHVNREDLDENEYIRIDESALEFEI